MLISTRMNGSINAQIGIEFNAAFQYLSIASHFASEKLNELSGMFFAQADEEKDHAMRFIKFLIDAGGRVEIPAMPSPKTTFISVEEAVQLSYDSEIMV